MAGFTYVKTFRALRGRGGLVDVSLYVSGGVSAWKLHSADQWLTRDVRKVERAIERGEYVEA